jgi:D-cysteine desulfhydrase
VSEPRKPAIPAAAAPPRVMLARLPTPLEPSRVLGARLGVPLWWKRDDLTGAELSGNKVRKLEFLLADAEAAGADVVITCGGEQSNHCRATALSAARRGLGCVLLLRVADPAAPPPLEANSLLGRLAGAEIRYLSVEQYRRRDEVFHAVSEELRGNGRRPYVIPEGGSNAVGAWGYIHAVAELHTQLGGAAATLVYAAGSGGTGAGIELGLRRAGWSNARALGFAVCDDRATFQAQIARIAAEASRRYHLGIDVEPEAVEINDKYIGPGYAQSTPEMLATIVDVARAEGIVLDPVYTGKAFFGLVHELGLGSDAIAGDVVFIHTGGIFGLLPFTERLRPHLGAPRS